MPAARMYVPPPCIGFVDQSTTYSVLTSISGIYGASSDIGRLYLMSVIVIEAVTYIHSTLFSCPNSNYGKSSWACVSGLLGP
ncbi:hypothetical protein H9L39_06783 [Fusarium oxysporum f. sp. albedinis]|nr:hypothetical protein H9L39_06783 [Fusarium oxysporum f. sp. albedinis]